MHILFGYNRQIIFCYLFHKLNLVIFTTKVNGFKVLSFGTSFYNVMPIPLILYRCSGHGLKLCILSAYNPQIIFTVKVDGFKVFCVENSSFSFMSIPFKCYRYLGHGLKMCKSFGNNPQIIFVTFYRHFLGIITFKVNS